MESANNAFNYLRFNLERALNSEQKIEVDYVIPFNDVAFLDFLVNYHIQLFKLFIDYSK